MSKFNKLSRAEMKGVTGGLLYQGQAYCSYSGSCGGWGPAGPYDQQGSTGTIEANEFQRSADRWCSQHDCCTDVDCPGAVGSV